MLLEPQPPLAEPHLLNARGMTRQDSILNALSTQASFYSFYSDASKLSYALGGFAMTGATTDLPLKSETPPPA